MAVMAREAWTDERLDDLVKRVDTGFDETKLEIRDLRADMNKGFDEAKGEIREVKGEVRVLRSEMNTRFDGLQRTMTMGFVGVAIAVVGAVLAG